MKRMAMLLLLVCFITGLVFVGCEKSSDDGTTVPDTSKVTKAAEDTKADVKKEAEKIDVDKEADKAKEGLDALTK